MQQNSANVSKIRALDFIRFYSGGIFMHLVGNFQFSCQLSTSSGNPPLKNMSLLSLPINLFVGALGAQATPDHRPDNSIRDCRSDILALVG